MPKILELILDEAGNSETRTFVFDFAAKAEIVAGDTLTGTPVVLQGSAPAGAPSLTLGAPAIATNKTQVQVAISISGGVAGSLYSLTCRVNTAGGATLIGRGDLQVIGPQ